MNTCITSPEVRTIINFFKKRKFQTYTFVEQLFFKKLVSKIKFILDLRKKMVICVFRFCITVNTLWCKHLYNIKSTKLSLQNCFSEYGGIYLDTDQLLLTSLDKFRNRECTMGMAADGYLGSAVIIARKNSAFIKKWMDSYSAYKPNAWGENSVINATKLAKQNPDLIHTEKHYCSFYPHPNYLSKQNYKWSHSYGLHIYKPGRVEQLKQLNFSSIRKLSNTLGAAFRFVLFDNKELCLWFSIYNFQTFQAHINNFLLLFKSVLLEHNLCDFKCTDIIYMKTKHD